MDVCRCHARDIEDAQLVGQFGDGVVELERRESRCRAGGAGTS
jgi:hypothetical protein